MRKINPKLKIVAYYNQFSIDKPISTWGVSPVTKEEAKRGAIEYGRKIFTKMAKEYDIETEVVDLAIHPEKGEKVGSVESYRPKIVINDELVFTGMPKERELRKEIEKRLKS
ncbi:MAG: hypothetical protein AB1485_00540 [Candidatus Thermoplasmatota archaeon]